ncbi:MAG: right-handed parallel beta-helix repeat-containing protein [Thermoanaerobaculia bacterium]
MRLLTAIAVSALFFPGVAGAATHYVATNGNDAAIGSISAPFRTITKGAGVARPGDTVSIRGGVYNEIVKASAKGTAAARITIQSYPGEKAIIDGTGTASATDLVQLGSAEYLDFTGFEVRNSNRLGISGWGSKNVRILNNTVHHSLRGGIYVGHSSFGNVYDITIADNTVYNNVLENQNHNMNGGWAQSISVQYADRATIARNRVYQNDGEGIVLVLSDNSVVEANEVSDSFSVGIYLDNAQYSRVEGNFVYSSGNSRYFRDGFPASGIATANESYSASNPLTNLTITNNIVVDTRYGFYYGAFEAGGGLKNTTIANNTFYKARASMVWLEADAHSNNAVQNNIFFQAGGGSMHTGTVTGSTFRNNNWYGGNAGLAAGAADILGDPKLVNAGGLTAADYKLAHLSPAIHTALDASIVAKDFWGNTRSAAYDIGAHEQSISLGSSSPVSIALDAPAGVRAVAQSSVSVHLTWTAVEGASGYRIYRDRALAGSASTTSWSDNDLSPLRSYSYAITAIAGQVNESAPSVTVVATTPAQRETQAPSVPTAVTATALNASQIKLTWAASTDNNGVTGYVIYRNGAHVATVNATTWVDNGLTAATAYTYEVAAFDAASNYSGRGQASATTKPASGRARAVGRK